MKATLAVLAGDGIGPEITREGLKVLDAVADTCGHAFAYHPAPFGAAAYFSCGSPFPEQTRRVCDEADVIVKGPVGLAVERMESIPIDCRPEKGAILPLRKRYDTFANFRPVFLPAELAFFSPLKEDVVGNGIDILMIRELVGGIYFGEKIEASETNNDYAADRCVYTGREVERIARVAFGEAARKKMRLTNVHKANILASSRFWNSVIDDVRREFPQVEYQSVLVDNAAFQLVKNPTRFNGVMLLENMQGDILTDQAGGILGSLGLMPSACIGPEKSYVEPAHGSAPDIGGKNIANPYSMIGSVALMLERCLGLEEEGRLIFNAMTRLFQDGFRTADLADCDTDRSKVLSTSDFGDRVAAAIRK
jgi:3-isopropylmalate dehydrogenase